MGQQGGNYTFIIIQGYIGGNKALYMWGGIIKGDIIGENVGGNKLMQALDKFEICVMVMGAFCFMVEVVHYYAQLFV